MEKLDIPVCCIDLEKRTDDFLRPWATKFKEAIRDTEESKSEETYRTNFRRDRDRILYTRGFRTLQYKTQVFVNTAGDYYRTRLTHTLEVQQLATSMADALGVNRDLAEAIAVGHDVGHSPFGHIVESLLADKMEKYKEGTFAHAIQSVRYVEHLERHTDSEGLNLTKQVREGILKHDTDIFECEYNDKQKKQWDCSHLNPDKTGSLEMQIVYWADKIAYLSHDWDDFINSGIQEEAVREGIIKQVEIDNLWDRLILDKKKSERELRDLIRNINKNIIEGTISNIESYRPESSDDVRRITEERIKKCDPKITRRKMLQKSLMVNFTDDYREAFLEAKAMLFKVFVDSPTVARMNDKAKCMISEIFEKYMGKDNVKLLPWNIQKLISDGKEPKARLIADYIVSMTDRYANSIYEELFLPWR